MRNESFESLVDFVKSSEDGMQQVQNLPLALRVLGEILEDSAVPIAQLLQIATTKLSYTPRLLKMLAEVFSARPQDQRREFITALSCLSDEVWSNVSPAMVRVVFQNQEDFAWLFEHFDSLMLDPDSAFFEVGNPDAYWLKRIQTRIDRGDYTRAWEEIKKAGRGIALPGDTQVARMKGRAEYIYQLSTEAMVLVVRRLYEEMREHQLVPVIPDEPYIVPSREVGVPIYETKVSRRRRPAQRTQSLVRAGFDLAYWYFSADDRSRGPFTFTPEGGMLLVIAGYHRTRRTEQRRAKNEQLRQQQS